MRGMRARIYKGDGRDYSNGGISSYADEVTVIGPGIPELSEATADAPAVRINVRHMGSERIVSLEPIDRPVSMVGPMMGGCYVAASDSRLRRAFGIYGAVALHDRFETPEQYRALST